MSRFNLIPKLARITFNLRIAAFIVLTILLFHGSFLQPAAAQNERHSDVIETDTVYVPAPTVERKIDRANILSAIDKVQPGGTIQFAPGKYTVGKVIQINNPQITLLGHPDGTILRGCEPEELAEIEKALETVTNPTEGWAVVSSCGMLELTGGNVTVRNFTFEYTRLGLLLGSSHAEDILYPSEGGYLIEENTFRNSSNSIRAMLASPEPTIIRNNRFINVFHAFSGAVSNFHILDNHISAPDHNKILPAGHPGFAIGLSALVSHDTVTSSCKQNLISGNQIVGHPDGIILSARQTDAGCQNNVIQANTIEVQRAKLPASWPYFEHYPISDNDSTLVGIPLSFVKNDKPLTQDNTFKNNLIEDNQIAGAEGLGIEILNASQNRIINNTITGIINRQPFPGNTLGGTQFGSTPNGSGIWISPGSNGNEIIGNVYEDIASYVVFVEGDSNRVEVRDLEDDVRDLGSGNRLIISNENKETEKIESRSESKCSDPSPHKIRFVTVAPGVQLEVLDWGGSGETLVFLAGLQMNANAFDDFAPRFIDSHRAVGITRRGHGASSWPDDDYSLERLVEDIRIVLDTLGLEHVILAGHSMAGMEITHFASEYPERVAGLVYIDAGHDLTLIEGHGLMAVCPMGPEILGAIEKRFDNPKAFNHTQKYVAPDETLIPFVSNNAVARLFAGFKTPDYSAVRAPALAVYDTPRQLEDVFGGETALSPECISAMQRYIYEGIAGFAVGMERAWIVAINDSHHNLHLVSPDTLEEVMRRWLADLPE